MSASSSPRGTWGNSILASYDDAIRTYTLSHNVGQGCARNIGVMLAHSSRIAFLDADDYYADDDALAILLSHDEQLIYGDMVAINAQGDESHPLPARPLTQTTLRDNVAFYPSASLVNTDVFWAQGFWMHEGWPTIEDYEWQNMVCNAISWFHVNRVITYKREGVHSFAKRHRREKWLKRLPAPGKGLPVRDRTQTGLPVRDASGQTGKVLKPEWPKPESGAEDHFGYRLDAEIRKPTTAAIITSHNYGRFLKECLGKRGGDRGVLAQSRPFDEIVIIADACDSSDKTTQIARECGIKCYRTSFKDACQARNYGMDVTHSDYVWFGDADDIPERDLHAKMWDTLIDERIAIAYPWLQRFGARDSLWAPEHVDLDYLIEYGGLQTSALMRREQVDHVGRFTPGLPRFQDLDLFWRMLKKRWKAKASEAILYHREHEHSLRRRVGEEMKHFKAVVRKNADILIVAAFVGRKHLFHRFTDALDKLKWDHEKLHLLFYDNSCDPSFSNMLWDYLREAPFGMKIVVPDRRPPVPVAKDYAEDPNAVACFMRIADIYNYTAEICPCEFAWYLDDDVIVQDEYALERLMDAMERGVPAVSAVYRSRHKGNVVARYAKSLMPFERDFSHDVEPNGDVIDVDMCGFGCVLIRRRALKSAIFHPRAREGIGADFMFGRDVAVRFGEQIKLHGGVVCDHVS